MDSGRDIIESISRRARLVSTHPIMPISKQEQNRRHQAKHGLKIRARQKAWRLANPEKLQGYRAKRHADPDQREWGVFTKRLRTYGITLDQYHSMAEKQEFCCAVCGEVPNEGKRGGDGFHIDHNHVTNRVRGLLCGNCNVGLGMFSDSPTILDAAKSYLLSTSV